MATSTVAFNVRKVIVRLPFLAVVLILACEEVLQMADELPRDDIEKSIQKRVSGESDLTTIVIPREFAERALVYPILEQLLRIYSDSKNIHLFHGWLSFSVNGYGDDDRELFQIPEVCDYFKSLSASFPFLFYFLNLEQPTLAVVMNCVSDAEYPTARDGTVYVQVDGDKLQRFVLQQFGGLNKLFADHDLDRRFPKLNRELSDRATQYIEDHDPSR